MVIEVFPSAGDGEHTLGQEGLLVVLEPGRVAWIGNGVRQAFEEPHRAGHFAEQQGSGIRGDGAAVAGGQHPTASQGCKSDRVGVTVCRHGLDLLVSVGSVVTPESTRGRAVAL